MTRFLPLHLRLEAPLVLPNAGGDPNAVNTLAYIPGSSLRGAAAAALLSGTPVETAEFERLILDGSVRWLAAYPLIGTQRTMPAPLSWREQKVPTDVSASDVWDILGVDESTAPELRPLSAGQFVTLSDPSPRRTVPRLRRHLHFQMDRDRQRATEEVGAVFTYEALAEEQEFAACVAVSGSTLDEIEIRAERIEAALDGHLWLGRSRDAGYGGRCRLTWFPLREREYEGSALLSGDLSGNFRVVLTSDYIGRNPVSGALDPGAFVFDLVRALPGCEIRARAYEPVRCGGFNRTWRMELPQATGLRGGSQFLLHAPTTIARRDWLELETSGLGERRAEGFGRILFLKDWPGPDAFAARSDGARNSRPTAPPSAVINDVEKSIELRRLLRLAEENAFADAQSPQAVPSPHLLSRLRFPLGQGATGLEALAYAVADAKDHAGKQLDRCRIQGMSLKQRLLTMKTFEFEWLRPSPGAITHAPLTDISDAPVRLRYAATLLKELTREGQSQRRRP